MFVRLCLLLLLATSDFSLAEPEPSDVLSVVRHPDGDYYSLKASSVCRCMGGGASTTSMGGWSSEPSNTCRCRCPHHRPVLRDDNLACTDSVNECVLAEFVGPGGRTRVPHVYLPVQGQLVNPSAEVAIMGLESPAGTLVSPLCVVKEARKLTRQGWQQLPNSTDFEPPFRLYRNKGRTFLRWLGDEDSRWHVEGHLVLVMLLCRDTSHQNTPHFSPCVAFRASGTSNLQAGKDEEGGASTTAKMWLLGGTVVGLSLMIYLSIVASLLYRKKRSPKLNCVEIGNPSNSSVETTMKSNKRSKTASHYDVFTSSLVPATQSTSSASPDSTLTPPEHLDQQVGYSNSTSPNDSPNSQLQRDSAGNSSKRQIQNCVLAPSICSRNEACFSSQQPTLQSYDALDSEAQPATRKHHQRKLQHLQMQKQLRHGEHNHKNGGHNHIPGEYHRQNEFQQKYSEHHHKSGDGYLQQGDHPNHYRQNDNQQPSTSAPVHQPFFLSPELQLGGSMSSMEGRIQNPAPSNMTSGNEQNGRKKLYFNPSYFEPELLQEPPPAALDFLSKIREIISSAKTKMRTKTFQPSLNDIPEDDYTYASQSRPHSRCTSTPRTKSRVSFNIAFSSKEDVEDLTTNSREYTNVVSTDPQVSQLDETFTADSLDECSDGGSRASTLRRIAKRVNERGTSFVSEIIKNLDRKNRDGSSEVSYCSSKLNSSQKNAQFVKVHTCHSKSNKSANELRSQARIIVNSDERQPALIKPSLLRSIMNDGKQKSEEASSSFDNFCQEMMATFNRIKKYGESKTPISTLGKSKSRQSTSNEAEVTESTSSGNCKVEQWLEGLENEIPFDLQSSEEAEQQEDSTSFEDADSLSIEKHYDLTKSVEDIERSKPTDEIEVTPENEIILSPSVLQNFGTMGASTPPSENSYEVIDRPVSSRAEDNCANCCAVSEDSQKEAENGTTDSNAIYQREETIHEKSLAAARNQVSPHASETEDDLNTSYDKETLDRKLKRRNARSRSVLIGKYSDYCATDSEDFYDATSGISVQSIATPDSSKYVERDSGLLSSIEGRIDLKDNDYRHDELRSAITRNDEAGGERPPLPPKLSCSPERHSASPPVRPPKSKRSSPSSSEDKPPLPAKETKIQRKVTPPSLPAKTKISGKSPLTNEVIPELSDEAAASILLGLQAHPSALALVSLSREEDLNAVVTNPVSPIFYSDSITETQSIKSVTELDLSTSKIGSLKSNFPVVDRQSSTTVSEERIRGQFILASEGKSPMSRKNSLSRSGLGSTPRCSSSDTDISRKKLKLCQCAKTELEKHFIEKGKPDADTIKKTWRRVVKKSDSSQTKSTPWKARLANIEENQSIDNKCSNCTKQKQDDSGYQSSDSSETTKSSTTVDEESSCSIDLDCSESIDTALTSIKRRSGFGPQIFPKSQSLQHLQEVPVHDVYRSFDGSPCSSSPEALSASSIRLSEPENELHVPR
ncbi:hypothetical protein FHG87_003194 [Trinorchestia longiramus]|nr:hypothetical protein FHG87_003194 [Trinorchestia longiramus]